MTKKNIPKIIKNTLTGLLGTAILGIGAYTLATSQIKLEPQQGAIVRELRNVNNELYNAPRGIINNTNKSKRFKKQPYIPGLEIGSVEEYFDLNKARKIDGTFAFWSKDRITLERDDREYVRAFNFGCDVDVINLEAWTKWDPVKDYGRTFSYSEINSREEALSQIIEEAFLSGIKDTNGNYEFTDEGLPKFLGLSQQTVIWYNQLVARHDFLIDKLEENGLLDKLDNLNEEGKKEIKEFYNDFFEKNPWYKLGPLRLEAEGQSILSTLESSYFSQYPWWIRPMFYNNYSGETKQKAMASLYGINPPKDMMANEENLREIPEIESKLYRDYPKLTELSQKLSDVIKYDTEINAINVMKGAINNRRQGLQNFKETIPQDYHKIIDLIEKEIQQTFNSSDSSLESLSQILDSEKGEEELDNKLNSMVGDYANAQLQIAQIALMNEGSKEVVKRIGKSISDLELVIKEEGTNVSNGIINDYQEYILAQTGGEFTAKDLPFEALQQSWEAFIQSNPYQLANENILQHTVTQIILNRQERLSNSAGECMDKLDNQKVAKLLYESISKGLQAQNIDLKEINEFNIESIVNPYVTSYSETHALEYIAAKLNLNVHKYAMNNDLMEVENIRKKELIPFFEEYLLNTQEKEMKLWDYALENILSGNG
ncbi:hypothetical protein KAR52_02780, partial [Candidatus Pacearchaeota archaeon]|nr:hypothetical protein [Candidatus Pacearchaeota archaeon]